MNDSRAISDTYVGPTGKFRISAWAIRNPIPVTVLFLALMLAGWFSYYSLPIKQFPNIEFPLVTVTVTENGAAPEQMETQVTRPVEDALAGLPDVRHVSSTVSQGVSTTAIEFEMGVDLRQKTEDVRSRMDQVRAQLPLDIDPPVTNRVDIASAPIATYAVYAPNMSPAQLSWFVDDTVTRTLQAQPGVAQLDRFGGANREINVIVDPDRLAAHGLTASQVSAALRTFETESPGGRVQFGGQEQTLRVLGTVDTVQALRQLTIPVPGGRFVKLTDVADVGDGAGEMRGFARLNGHPVVGFQIEKTRDASDVTVDNLTKKALAGLEKANPGVRFTRIYASVDDTRASFRATLHVLTEGMLLAAAVVFLFLRDWRATLITAAAMPISLVPTFFVMHLLGFSLNVVTLLALTLVIGILVDDAIVEIENIEKRVAAGLRPYDAAMQGADSIGLAVVATTMTIVAVFTPVSFMKGIFGQFFYEFGITVSIAVLFSLLVARLLTPLLAAYLLKPRGEPHARKPFTGFYRNALDWALDHRIVSCVIGVLLFFASMAIPALGLIPTAFQPDGNPDYVYVNIQGPPGATLSDMETTVNRIQALMQRQPEVTGVFAQVGSTAGNPFGGGGGNGLNSGTVTVLLNPKRAIRDEQFRARLRPALLRIPDARVSFLDSQGNVGYQQILTSDNHAALQQAAVELEREMRTLKELADPRPSTPPTAPEVVIQPRFEEAARLGVSTDTLAQIVRIATVGDIDSNVAKLDEGERRIPIRVRLPDNARMSIERLRNMRVPTANGGVTTLGSVADVYFQAGPATIDRLNRKRQITIQAQLNGVQLGQAVKAVNNLPIMRHLPPGVTPADIGEQQQMQEMFSSFGGAILTGVGMIFAVLILLFRSFFKPTIILSALPLAVGGAFLGLMAFHSTLSLPSLIGFLMLLGLAAKNSILLVEYAIERERAGLPQREALLEACRERARPIVMTTVAMAAGMLPTAVALESGSEFRQPMAVAVIGGLITSTLLSLVLVPVVYEFIDDVEQWIRPKLARLLTKQGPLPDAAPAE